MDAGDRLDAVGEARRGTSPPCGRGWRRPRRGSSGRGWRRCGWPMMWRAVLVERQLAAALGEDRRRRRRGAGGRCRRGCRRGRRGARPAGVMPARGAAAAASGAGVVGGGADAAEREEVDALDRRSRGSRPCGRRARRGTRSARTGSISLVRSAARRCSTREATGRRRRSWRSLISVCSLAGPATPMWTGRCDAGGARGARPRRSTGAASKQNWVAIAIAASVSRWKPALAREGGHGDRPRRRRGRCRGCPRGGRRRAGRVKPRASKRPVRRSCIASEKAPRGRVDAAGDHQRLGGRRRRRRRRCGRRARRGRRCRGPGSAA